MSETSIPIFLGSLTVMNWEVESHPILPENPTPEALLKFLCPLDTPSDMSEFKNRYVEISVNDWRLPISVEEPEIKENLYVPLRQAKMNYILGNYVGVIALCSIVAEKAAILVYKINETDETKREKFEKEWYQAKRVRALKMLGFIDEYVANDFCDIIAARKSPLHHWSTLKERTAERAVQVYAAAIRIVIATTDFNFVDGKLSMNPKLYKYLEDRGALRQRG